jgi:uncharacterized protein
MAIYFLDSSAIVKRYIAETGSAWLASLIHPVAGHQLHVARISAVEVLAAITRRVRVGSMSAEEARIARMHFRLDFSTLQDVVEITGPLIARAMDIAEKHELRAYDAVQLSAAMAVHEGARAHGLAITIVTADDELITAATAEGLAVENPNRHP